MILKLHTILKKIKQKFMKGGQIKMAVVKVLNLVGESPISWQDAVENAVAEASKTVKNITGVEVLNTTGVVQDGKIVEYRANVNIAFKVENNR